MDSMHQEPRKCAARTGPLEPNCGTECEPEIMMRAAGEIHFIAGIHTQSEWTPERFDAAAGIKFGDHVAGSQVRNRAAEGAEGDAVGIEAEAGASAFGGEKHTHRTTIELKLWSEEPVDPANVGAREGAVAEAFGEDLVEVIAHFGFELEPGCDVEAGAGAHSGQVRARLAPVVEFAEDAELEVVEASAGRAIGGRLTKSCGRGETHDRRDSKHPWCALHGFSCWPGRELKLRTPRKIERR